MFVVKCLGNETNPQFLFPGESLFFGGIFIDLVGICQYVCDRKELFIGSGNTFCLSG